MLIKVMLIKKRVHRISRPINKLYPLECNDRTTQNSGKPTITFVNDDKILINGHFVGTLVSSPLSFRTDMFHIFQDLILEFVQSSLVYVYHHKIINSFLFNILKVKVRNIRYIHHVLA